MSDDLHHIYYISDRTGRTAELSGDSLLNQFPDLRFKIHRYPFIDSMERLSIILELISERAKADQARLIIFSTLVEPKMRQALLQSGAHVIDLYETWLTRLEQFLETPAKSRMGVSHEDFETHEESDYQRRSQALEFTLNHDDGLRPDHYEKADVIILGVSRSAKTPVSLYLAMHFFIRAANYPLTGEDLDQEQLPPFLRDKREKIVGLQIAPKRLHDIRTKRRPDSEYASLRNCMSEVRRADELCKLNKIPLYDSSCTSVEEIAVAIVKRMNLLG